MIVRMETATPTNSLKPAAQPPIRRNRLRELRRKRNLTLGQVATAVGISFQHLSYAERTGRRIGLDAWLKLARFYELPVEELFEE
jgi:transcriptional regulator with XRE-family HTH domain